ncbi:MAG: DMT family transporter [Rhodospirillaceae bacterium]|nr:MAG: DMT family transporter [Rhodospirillaceae bacterium]
MTEPVTTPKADLPQADNLRGAMWMFGSSMCFATCALMVKVLGSHLPTLEIAFLRCLLGLSILVPIILRHGWRVYRTTRVDLHLIRVVCSTFGVSLGFYAFAHLHLATAISLGFTRPLFMIILARTLLGEQVHWRRGLATVIGFIGVLVVLGPSDVSDMPAAIGALIGAACIAGAMAVVRRQSATEGAATIMVWYATGVCVTTALPAYFVWQTPNVSDWSLLISLGVMSSIGQYLMIHAFTVGEATVVNPVDYSQIIVTSLAGYFFFAEVPTVWTLVGVAIIIASTLYIVLREAALQKIRSLSA